jgi:CheY-like chemotaxis protein
MDIQLEGAMDGIETAEAIRSRYDVPIVYLTAHSDCATLSRAKLTGPLGYILKPFDDRELFTQIELGTYKHKVDLQLHQQREWLRVTLSSIAEAVIAAGPDESIAFMNPMAESLTGWQLEEANGKPLNQVFHLIDKRTRKLLSDRIENLLNTGKISSPSSHFSSPQPQKETKAVTR